MPPIVVPYRKLGNGDPMEGFRKMNAMPYLEARKLVAHPVACIDCHDPATMSLRVTRPGFIVGIRELKASQGVKDYDVNRQASQKEMRAFVCGQCHVEYYFKGTDKQLTYPWSKGLKVDDILAYYDEAGSRTGSTSDRRARAQGAAPRVRDVEPGHPRPLGRDLRRLPHAGDHVRGADDHRPPGEQPAPQGRGGLHEVPRAT